MWSNAAQIIPKSAIAAELSVTFFGLVASIYMNIVKSKLKIFMNVRMIKIYQLMTLSTAW